MKTIIVGYQHTVIPLAATDMFLHQKEQKLIPLPDKIVTVVMKKKVFRTIQLLSKRTNHGRLCVAICIFSKSLITQMQKRN